MTHPGKPISPLRQRMLDDMRMRKLSDQTQSHYIRVVVNFTRFLGRSPDTATAEDLRRYQLHMVETGSTRMSLNRTITALRFFFAVTLECPEALAKMSTVREPRKLPVVLSRAEVSRLIEAAAHPKYQAVLSVAYGAGLRAARTVTPCSARYCSNICVPGGASPTPKERYSMAVGCCPGRIRSTR
jgi:integrase/recombinase XerD